jgi:alpha-glucuronidase
MSVNFYVVGRLPWEKNRGEKIETEEWKRTDSGRARNRAKQTDTHKDRAKKSRYEGRKRYVHDL